MLRHPSVLYFRQIGLRAAWWYDTTLSFPFLVGPPVFSLTPFSSVLAGWYGPTVRGLPTLQRTTARLKCYDHRLWSTWAQDCSCIVAASVLKWTGQPS